MIYKVLKRMIALGKTDGLAEKIDVYYAAGRITTDQYNELMELLPAEEENA